MVTFNELRICEDGSKLIVDCEVEGIDIYNGIYIKNIYLDYYKNASYASMPSSKAYKIYENKYNDTTVRSKRITLSEAEVAGMGFGVSTFDGALFYVIVECDGSAKALAELEGLPCGYDQTVDIGAILDWAMFYRKGMGYIASMFDKCGNPCAPTDAFEHFILLWNALKLAIETCDWDTVIDLWDKFLLSPNSNGGSSYSAVVTSGCGCGR